ncbi:MAG: glycosyltransferase family 1 protein [Nitrospirae bacterium]|nr:MAG: glycosyltransferase family 1 protein [Nitrospirota bacterium]
MKILFCNYEYPPLGGGGGVVNAFLARELAKRHQVTVLTSQGLGLPAESVSHGVRILRVPVYFRRQEAVANLLSMLMFLPSGILAGRHLVAHESFDLINTHFVLPSGPVGDKLSRQACIPHILSLHGGDLYDPSKRMSPHRHWLLKVWIRRMLIQADQVVGQSKNTIDNLHRYYNPEIRAILIPLGIPEPRIPVAERETYGFSRREVLLITIGRLVPRKAISQLIELMHLFKGQPVRLLIVGSGPQEAHLRGLCERLKVADQVVFCGFVDEEEKYRLLSISDVYVSSSQHEGFGLVFLEAMACGLPILCYDRGGQTDFLIHGQSGFLVKLNDWVGFSNQCQRLISDRFLRQEIGARNRQEVKRYFIERCAERYEELFQQVLEQKE